MPARPIAHYLEQRREYQLRDSNSLKLLIFRSQRCNMQICGVMKKSHWEKNPLNLIWEAVGRFFEETSQ